MCALYKKPRVNETKTSARFWIQLHNNKAHDVGCFRLGDTKLRSKTFFCHSCFCSLKSNAYLWLFHVSFNRNCSMNVSVLGCEHWEPVVADRNRFLISDDSLKFDQTANHIEVFYLFKKKKFVIFDLILIQSVWKTCSALRTPTHVRLL